MAYHIAARKSDVQLDYLPCSRTLKGEREVVLDWYRDEHEAAVHEILRYIVNEEGTIPNIHLPSMLIIPCSFDLLFKQIRLSYCMYNASRLRFALVLSRVSNKLNVRLLATKKVNTYLKVNL